MLKSILSWALLFFACGDAEQVEQSGLKSEKTAPPGVAEVEAPARPSVAAVEEPAADAGDSKTVSRAAEAFASALPFGGPDCKAYERELRRNLQRLNLEVDKAVLLSEQHALLSEKVNSLKVLKAQEHQAVLLLAELRDATPEKVKLDTLSETAGRIKIAGIAASNPDLSKFITALEDSELFGNVLLNTIEQTRRSGIRLKSFSISMKMQSLAFLSPEKTVSSAEQGKSAPSSAVPDSANDSLGRACPDQAELRAQLDLRRGQTASLSEWEERLIALRIQLEDLQKNLPRTYELPELIKSISEKGIASGLQISRFVPEHESADVNNEFVSRIPLAITVEGGFHQLADFFDRIAKMDRTVHVKDLDIEMVEESATKGVIHASFKFVTYRFLSDDERERASRKQAAARRGGKGRKAGKSALPGSHNGVSSDAWRDFSYTSIGKRDPFKTFLSETEDSDKDGDVSITALQKYKITEYTLVGVISEINRPRALVQDPNGQGHVMELGTYIGQNWGKVTSISDNSVIITEEYTTHQGELVVETIEMRLRNTGSK